MASIPTHIGIFEVLREIGAGGMGAVYLGRDPELNRQVAIKVIKERVRDQEILDRFFREARAAAALRHPNIITIYASGQHEQQPYIAMEFVEGDSLADIIRDRKQLTLVEKISYIDQLCAGLNFAHRAGIVHRDIKPANIMVDHDGVVRILDFGIARIEGSAMTQDGALIGSLNYMSPEQMLGRAIDYRSDIFSVGSLAYELLSYQQAFKGSLNDGLLHRLPNEDPPPLTEIYPGLPPAIEDVINRALAKSPDDRFQNLADMRTALTKAQSGGMPSADDRTIQIKRDAPPRPAATTNLENELFGSTTSTGSQMMWEPPPPSQVSAPPPSQFGEPQLREPQEPHSQVFEPLVDTPAAESPSSAAAPPPQPTVVESRPPTQTPPPATVIKPPSTSVKTSTPVTMANVPSTISRSPSTISKPPATAVVRPPAPPVAAQGSSKKWLVIAVALVALVGGAIVAIPMFTAQPDPREAERPRVVDTMERFRTAYRTKNLNGMAAIFPALPAGLRQNMQRAFATCLLYDVRFSDMQVELNPDATEAQVNVRSAHECTPNSNERQTTTTRDDAFTLQRQNDNWVIASVVEKASKAVQ
jgi:serine/threonine protein kinase